MLVFTVMLFDLVSYNQPKIAANATWYPCATTFANQSTVGQRPRGIFIHLDKTVYVASHTKNEIMIWTEGNPNPTAISTPKLYPYTGLFVTVNTEIYFSIGNPKGQINKRPAGANQSFAVTKFSEDCCRLFIDLNDVLYCCMHDGQRVEKVSLNSGTNTPVSAAGTGSRGAAVNELDRPFGISVDIDGNLHVADSGNNRIVLYRAGQTIGEVVAGNGTPANLFLDYPTDVILDAEKVFYIVDSRNNRIIRAKDQTFSCIIGCTHQPGSATDQLDKPHAVRFDSDGNLYVADEYNDRIQKFTLTLNLPGQ